MQSKARRQWPERGVHAASRPHDQQAIGHQSVIHVEAALNAALLRASRPSPGTVTSFQLHGSG
jgi:hypothetical protein